MIKEKINKEDIQKEKKKLKRECFNYLDSFSENRKNGKSGDIKEKFNNICQKTGSYDVPSELFQTRTSRKNRVLISWRAVKANNLDIEKLNSFENGVVVEFLNEDFLDKKNQTNKTFLELKNRLGSDKNVSSIITFRKENGSPSSSIPQNAFFKFLNNTEVNYKGKKIIINKNNYKKYKLEASHGHGSNRGNDKWSGFLFVSIRGGKQETIETHKGKKLHIFNPACEYASEEVMLDIDLMLSYFAMHSINYNKLTKTEKIKHKNLIHSLEKILKNTIYELYGKKISLYNYCNIHPSLAIDKKFLYDPIQLKKISISNFDIKESNVADKIELTHNEAVTKGKYYWDETRKTILTPARPTNLFWSFHSSNMMQQDLNLKEYIEYENYIYKERQKHKRKLKKYFDFINKI